MGHVYHDLGVLATTEVIEVSVTDLIGEYVGQTSPKTRQLFEKALGKVLFIDEAYRLAEGHFAKEAVDEIVDCITKPEFANRLVVILAGYEEDINRLLDVNPGLSSRFPERISFGNLDTASYIDLMVRKLRANAQFDVGVLENPNPEFRQRLLTLFEDLSKTKNWANARDVETITKSLIGKVMTSTSVPDAGLIPIEEQAVLQVVEEMRSERRDRHNTGRATIWDASLTYPHAQSHADNRSSQVPPAIEKAPDDQHLQLLALDSHTKQDELDATSNMGQNITRDSGVSDEVWAQLQEDSKTAAREDAEHERLIKEQEAESDPDPNPENTHTPNDGNLEERRKLEADRLARLHARRERENEIVRVRKEQELRKKLKTAGLCPAGFQWFKSGGGYRCGGGSHFVSDQDLGKIFG